MVEAPHTVLRWPRYVRLINSAFPPIDLFEDIADPSDWHLLAAAEAKTNPRLAATIGNLDLVPEARRVGGVGASYVMAPFTHCSPDRAGRFHDGHTGAFYGADIFETALAEVRYHSARFLAATRQKPGWLTQMRELIGTIDQKLLDIRGKGFDTLLALDDYSASQQFARQAKATGENGIVYPSVRQPGGICFAAFYPDVPGIPKQGRHFSFNWDGTRIDMIRELTLTGDGAIFAVDD